MKRRADAVFKSKPINNFKNRVSSTLSKMQVRAYTSQKVMEYVGFESSDDLELWLKTQPGYAVGNHEFDHVIPTFAYTWKRSGSRVVRCEELDECEMRKMWSKDNLQLLQRKSNAAKGVYLPPDEQLLAIRHLWPAWWNNELPTVEIRQALPRCKGKSVLRVG